MTVGEQELSAGEIVEYFLDPDDPWEQPRAYVGAFERSRLLHELVASRNDSSDRVLELGCGAGANLAHLYDHGYRDLVTIEVNPDMLSLFESHHPQTFETAEVVRGTIQDEITTIPTDGVEVTAAVAVLTHLHPDHEFVFDELVRVTAETLITIENEETVDDIFFPRNYGDVFESRGCEQVDVVDSETLSSRTELSDNCYARVFSVDT